MGTALAVIIPEGVRSLLSAVEARKYLPVTYVGIKCQLQKKKKKI